MLINPISSQTNFQAVNQKYYQWAVRESKGCKRYGEILEQLRFRVDWGDIHPQDGIDTVNAIISLRGRSNSGIEHILDCFKKMLSKSNQL